MVEPIFTDYRRDLIAKTAADLLKVLFAGALAGRFFFEFLPQVRFGLLAVGLVFGLLMLWTCPLRKPNGGPT